jgi:glycosyltransferase involved in cell wall biosynthesis
VLGSYNEPYSLGVVDAMLVGLPVIGTKSGGTVEQIENSGGGMLVRPRRPEELAQGFREYLAQPELIRKHGAAAQEWARKQHNWKTTLTRMNDIYLSTSAEPTK